MSTRTLALAALLLPLLARSTRNAEVVPSGDQIAVSDVRVTEGDDGMTMFTATVTMTSSQVGPVSVQIYASPGTADQTEFMVPMATVTVAPTMPATAIGYVLGDRRFESDETFLLYAQPVTASPFLQQRPGTITIVDDDAAKAPRARADEVKVPEGSAGWRMLDVPIHLDRAVDYPVTIALQTMGGAPWSVTAPWGDYKTTSQLVTFAIGETTATASIPINGDTDWEKDGHFSVGLSSMHDAVVDTAIVPVTLVNDDAPVAVTIADVRVDEGQSARHPVSLRVTFASPAPPFATVHVDVVGGTARAGEDFAGQSVELHPSPGATSLTFATTIFGDTTPECDEGIIVEYQGVDTGDATKKEAKILLVDDDGPPTDGGTAADGGDRSDGGACPDPFATRSVPVSPGPDAAAPPPGDTPSDAAPPPADASTTPPTKSGGGCAVAGPDDARGLVLAALGLLVLVAPRRRRHRDIPVRSAREFRGN